MLENSRLLTSTIEIEVKIILFLMAKRGRLDLRTDEEEEAYYESRE